LKYSKKYYSYVLVVEDEQQPDLVGKIMIMQYGKTLKDKILAEKNGEISGVPCNVFDLSAGKDFVLLVKEIQTGDEIYPDYKNSMFKPETSSLPIYFEEKNAFKNVPLVDGKVDPKAQVMVKDFLTKREHELEEFGPKRLTDEQQAKINELTAFLTGKASASFNQPTQASSDDFEFEESTTSRSPVSSSSSTDEDDFFNDFN